MSECRVTRAAIIRKINSTYHRLEVWFKWHYWLLSSLFSCIHRSSFFWYVRSSLNFGIWFKSSMGSVTNTYIHQSAAHVTPSSTSLRWIKCQRFAIQPTFHHDVWLHYNIDSARPTCQVNQQLQSSQIWSITSFGISIYNSSSGRPATTTIGMVRISSERRHPWSEFCIQQLHPLLLSTFVGLIITDLLTGGGYCNGSSQLVFSNSALRCLLVCCRQVQ